MKLATEKTSFNIVMIGLITLLSAILGSSLRPVRPVQATIDAAGVQPEPIVINYTADATSPVSGANAGILLQGTAEDVYYLTEDGTRRRFQDRETFLAFGLPEEKIIRVGDDFLAAIPLGEELTRLVVSEQDNLYWMMNGQRWLVNEWREVVMAADYAGIPASHLDTWLQNNLPVRLNLENGLLLRDEKRIYYLSDGCIIPVTKKLNAPANVIDVPAGVLSVYPIQQQLGPTSLRLAGPVAEVRRGPDAAYPVIGPVGSRVQAAGRVADSQWVLVDYPGQDGWVAASALADQAALALLPVVNAYEVTSPAPVQAEPAALLADLNR